MAGGGVKINNLSIIGGANGKTPTLKIEDGNLYNSYDNGSTWHSIGKVEGKTGPAGPAGQNGVSVYDIEAVDTSFVFSLTNETSITVPLDTADCTTVTEAELSTLVANSIDTIASVATGSTPSVDISIVNNKARFSFVIPKGTTGVGVSTITVNNGYLVFNMTDGTSQTVALPVYDGIGD